MFADAVLHVIFSVEHHVGEFIPGEEFRLVFRRKRSVCGDPEVENLCPCHQYRLPCDRTLTMLQKWRPKEGVLFSWVGL